MFFDLIQSSYGIQWFDSNFCQYSLEWSQYSPGKPLIRFICALNRINPYSFRSPYFEVSELVHTKYDSIHFFIFSTKFELVTHVYIYLYTHTFYLTESFSQISFLSLQPSLYLFLRFNNFSKIFVEFDAYIARVLRSCTLVSLKELDRGSRV